LVQQVAQAGASRPRAAGVMQKIAKHLARIERDSLRF
jgi:hypothetical protein